MIFFGYRSGESNPQFETAQDEALKHGWTKLRNGLVVKNFTKFDVSIGIMKAETSVEDTGIMLLLNDAGPDPIRPALVLAAWTLADVTRIVSITNPKKIIDWVNDSLDYEYNLTQNGIVRTDRGQGTFAGCGTPADHLIQEILGSADEVSRKVDDKNKTVTISLVASDPEHESVMNGLRKRTPKFVAAVLDRIAPAQNA